MRAWILVSAIVLAATAATAPSAPAANVSHPATYTGTTAFGGSLEIPWTASTSTPPPDATPPGTRIASGPRGTTRRRRATFRFASTEPGSTFRCKLDRKPWRSCRSPRTYGHLRDGRHVFRVKATDAAGNVDPSPAKRHWRVAPG